MDRRRLKVLLVEDNEDDFIIIRDLLGESESVSFDLSWAAEAEEGLEWIESYAPDICLVDYRLGESTGVELLREVRKRGCQAPVILLTGQSAHEIDEQAMKAGASDYLVKDQLQAESLERAIRHAMDRQYQEEVLRESEERFRATFEQAAVGIALVAIDGQWMRVNQKLCDIFGYNREELFLLNFRDLAHSDDADADAALKNRMLAGEIDTYTVERCYIRKEGGDVWTNLTMSIVREETGDPKYLIAVIEDITTRKQAERELQNAHDELERRVEERTAALAKATHEMQVARDAADAANLAKSEFLSRMSHELRTPLNAVLGFGQILEMEKLTPMQLQTVGHIIKGGRHLLGLINEVLDLARIESGKLSLSLEPVAIRESMLEILALVRPLASKRQIRVEFLDEDGKACDAHVHADQQLLKQVMINLLNNAIKYNHEGGQVVLSCEWVMADKETSGALDRIRVSVRDTGPGLSAEKIERLFVPFERLGAEQSGVEGTGLGLALSRRMVDAMGGTMGIESVVGEGTTFWFELPSALALSERLKDESSAEPVKYANSVHTVLYIEDNFSNFQLVEQILRRRPGVKLITAMQGRLGLDLAREHRPDLVLLDLHLPDMSGAEVLECLRVDPQTRDLPIIILSADATIGQAEKLKRAGANDYLTKPLDVRHFLQILDGML